MLYLWVQARTVQPDGTSAPERLRWWIDGHSAIQNWQEVTGWDALLKATAPFSIQEVAVFFPTSSVQMLQQPMSKAQLRQIGAEGVRYLLEEYALTSIDQLDVRYQHHQQQLSVLAKPRADVALLLSSLGLTPWRVAALLPDFLLMPLTEQKATLLLDGPNRILRLNESYAVPADFLDLTLSHVGQLAGIEVIGDVNERDRAILEAYQAHTGIVWQPYTGPSSALLPDQLNARHAFNLAAYVREHRISSYWRAVAAVLVVCVAVQMLSDGLKIWRYNRVADATHAQAEKQYRQWFPDERHIVNLTRQMKGHLNAAGGADMTALSLISQVGPALSQSHLQAKKIRYTSSAAASSGNDNGPTRNGALELQVSAPTMAGLEALRSQIAQQGLKAELGSASNNADKSSAAGVMGTVKVSL